MTALVVVRAATTRARLRKDTVESSRNYTGWRRRRVPLIAVDTVLHEGDSRVQKKIKKKKKVKRNTEKRPIDKHNNNIKVYGTASLTGCTVPNGGDN